MSTHAGKPSKQNFRVGKLCPKCEKGKLEPCECSGCHKRNKEALVCKTCHFSNF